MSSKLDVAHLYSAHFERLRRYLLLKSGEAELSADIAQECFARLLTLNDDQTPDNALSYLYTVATHLLIDHKRNHHQSRTDSVPVDELASVRDPVAGPDVHTEARRQLTRLHNALADLPLRTRQIFQLCRFDGLSHQQAADHLSISTSSVQKHLAMALEFLRERMERQP